MHTDTIKTGDTVRIIKNKASSPRLRGIIGKDVVVERRDGNYLHIAGLGGGSVHYARFEKVKAADEIKIGTYIVSLWRDGKLLPATEPRTYVSDAQANSVAKQMAKRHGGRFVVFRATGEFEMPTAEPTYRAL